MPGVYTIRSVVAECSSWTLGEYAVSIRSDIRSTTSLLPHQPRQMCRARKYHLFWGQSPSFSKVPHPVNVPHSWLRSQVAKPDIALLNSLSVFDTLERLAARAKPHVFQLDVADRRGGIASDVDCVARSDDSAAKHPDCVPP